MTFSSFESEILYSSLHYIFIHKKKIFHCFIHETMNETMDEDTAGPSLECANHLARLFQLSEFFEIF